MSALEALKTELLAAVAEAADLAALEEVRVAAFGKKGRITGLMADMRSLSPDERKERGQAMNALKDEVGAALDVRKAELHQAALALRLEAERIDVTLPVRAEQQGRIHPITQTIDELTAIFADLRDLFRLAPPV